EYDSGDRRSSSGSEALDAMLDKGYWPGSSTLVAGPSGVGKTVMALNFLFGGLEAGEPGLLANLQENPTQLERTAQGFGWTTRNPDISVMYRSSVDLYIDQWVHEVL